MNYRQEAQSQLLPEQRPNLTMEPEQGETSHASRMHQKGEMLFEPRGIET